MNDLYSMELAARCKITPRDYQQLAHDTALGLWDKGERGVLVRLFTGGGKTPIACLIGSTWLSLSPEHRVLVVSYETQLVWQFAQEVEDFLGITPGIEMEKEAVSVDRVPRVVVACRASLLRAPVPERSQVEELKMFGIDDLGACDKRACKTMLRLLRQGVDVRTIQEQIVEFNARPEVADGFVSRVHKFDWRTPWLVIFDEAHRHTKNLISVGHIVDWFERSPLSKRLGLTATPRMGKNISIGYVMFPSIGLDYPLYSTVKPCGVKDGWAVPYIQKYVEVEGVDFKSLKKIAGDFDPEELERKLGEEATLAKLIEPLLDMVGERRTLIFSPGVGMAKNVALYINARVPCVCPHCGVVKWYSRKLVGDGAACPCGQLVEESWVKSMEPQAEAIWGEFAPQDRKEIYRGHQGGKFQFLSVCGLCLARDSLILTDRGEVPIQDVTMDMRLWDGIEFVSHGGVISKGIRPVIEYAGLSATGDHNVWTDNGWERFTVCKQRGVAIRVSGISGKAVRESCGYYRRDHSTWKKSTCWFGGSLRWLRETQHQVLQRTKDWAGGMQVLCKKLWCPELVVDALSLCKEAVRKPARLLLSRLRRSWHRVQVCFASGNGTLGDGEFGVTQRIDIGPRGKQWPLRTGQYPLGYSDGTSEQQEATSSGVQEKVEVFDILNAGPRHRFTANGLIVSNCREGYNDPEISCVAIFRPVSKKAASLAEQMKGRGCRPLRSLVALLNETTDAGERCRLIQESEKPNCLVVDLVGVTGLADCVSTIQIYAEGLPDEVVVKAEKVLLERGQDEEADVEEAIEEAKRLCAEEKERIRQERLEQERREQEDFERRSKAQATVTYTSHDVGTGSQYDSNEASEKQYRFIAFLGMDLHGIVLTKRQAGRVIGMLRLRKPLDRVAYDNGIAEGQWSVKGPSVKQLKLMAWKKIPHAKAQGFDASQLIDARIEPAHYETKKLEEIAACKNGDDLTAVAMDVLLVKSVLPSEVYFRLVAAGTAKRYSWKGDAAE